MRSLTPAELEHLEQRWREATDELWLATRAAAQAPEGPEREAAEKRQRRAEIELANIRQALRLFGLER